MGYHEDLQESQTGSQLHCSGSPAVLLTEVSKAVHSDPLEQLYTSRRSEALLCLRYALSSDHEPCASEDAMGPIRGQIGPHT
ncbi:hypothetical protein T265_09990 [Opisthorchis viverrini]|uniref:Uncharacterized protein n=1 Tax=Opisthorchis viverrini TaxID=6198 RepID=A0A074Z3U3_OPIVI|nr:hypothetical protein T265_09990 [Opisthorchis viverrini]KER21751.1 hypothetical protein T265_09990 [Opisthorchis viverrini]